MIMETAFVVFIKITFLQKFAKKKKAYQYEKGAKLDKSKVFILSKSSKYLLLLNGKTKVFLIVLLNFFNPF